MSPPEQNDFVVLFFVLPFKQSNMGFRICWRRDGEEVFLFRPVGLNLCSELGLFSLGLWFPPNVAQR